VLVVADVVAPRVLPRRFRRRIAGRHRLGVGLAVETRTQCGCPTEGDGPLEVRPPGEVVVEKLHRTDVWGSIPTAFVVRLSNGDGSVAEV